MWFRASIIWLAMMAAESVHGAVRAALLVPTIGDLRARQIGVAIGSAIILAIATVTSRWLGARTTGARLAVGCLWAGLTLAFEVALGRWGFGFG